MRRQTKMPKYILFLLNDKCSRYWEISATVTAYIPKDNLTEEQVKDKVSEEFYEIGYDAHNIQVKLVGNNCEPLDK
jgi:hypothetical protein